MILKVLSAGYRERDFQQNQQNQIKVNVIFTLDVVLQT